MEKYVSPCVYLWIIILHQNPSADILLLNMSLSLLGIAENKEMFY